MRLEKLLFVALFILSFSFAVSGNTNVSNNGNHSNATVSIIKDIVPHEVPLLVEVNFFAIVEENLSRDLIYYWDFGDGSEKTSKSNNVSYAYSEIGSYDLTLRTGGDYEETKIVSISVMSPVSSVNKTIADYKKRLGDVEKEIDKLEFWIKDNFKNKISLEELKSSLELQENKTLDGVGEQEAVEIMKKLIKLDVPKKFGKSMIVSESIFLQESGSIDFDVLKSLGAGSADDRDKVSAAIDNWIKENLDIKFESKSYAVYYERGKKELGSHIKVRLKSKKDVKNIFIVVDAESADFKSREEFKKTGNVYGKKIEGLKEEEIIEFLYPDIVVSRSIPFYVSPELGELDLNVVVGVCDNDGVCDSGENYRNCPNDCKKWFSSALMLIGLLIAAFVVYIILQEWYKRYYERHLFPDKNQLFNLVHFMNNSLNQGLSKNKVFNKLKDIGWKDEQLNYAWKKLHGKRTGMLEIPVLKWRENREVKRELEKRGSRINYREFKK